MSQPVLAVAEPVASTAEPVRWSLAGKILFRFAFVYLILYCWPGTGRSSILDAIPNYGDGASNESSLLKFTNMLEAPWRHLAPWVAIHIFHLQGAVTQYHPTGSGDTTLDYVLVFCFAVIAAFATLIWSVLDRRRPNYTTLYACLRLLVRFTLSFTMLSYGFAKVYPLQFRTPGLAQLTETYGEASPMGILWTFMGASVSYTKFCGLAEVAAGALLLFRRTTTLGALMAAGAMLNVAALNFSYDVPVKLYSTHLVLMSLFLMAADAGALLRFFVLREPARLEGVSLPPFERRWLRIAAISFQALVISSIAYNKIWGGYKTTKMYEGSYFKNAPLYGVWNADTASAPWRQLTIQSPRGLSIRDISGERLRFTSAYDEANHNLKLTSGKQEDSFTYEQPDPQHLVLRGTGTPMTFHRLDASKFLLTSRGFHWISEDPFNR